MSTISQIQTKVGVKADGVWGSRTQAAVASALGCAGTNRSIQETVGTKVDGILGPKTYEAILAKLSGHDSTVAQIQSLVGVKSDGLWGPATQKAVATALKCENTVAAIQDIVNVIRDGVAGRKTFAAILTKLRGNGVVTAAAAQTEIAPDFKELGNIKQSDIRAGKTIFGKAGDEGNMVYVKPPYTIYYDGKPYKHGVRVHKAAAPSLEKIFAEVLSTYGPERIHALHLDDYAGGYTYKKTTGGSSMSIHSWGCAIDWWPSKNALKTHAPAAGFSGKDYEAWWRIWEKYGWHSLGREKDYDWMHVQIGALK